MKHSKLSFLTLTALLLLVFVVLPASAKADKNDKVVILCFDGVDGEMTAEYMEQGLLPNLKKLSERGTYSHLDTTNPPQTPVSWAAFSTGWHPGKTQIFDFLVRNEGTYLPRYSQVTISSQKLFLGKANPIVFGVLAGLILFLITFFLLKIITKKKLLALIAGVVIFVAATVIVFMLVKAWLPYETTSVKNNRKGTPFWDVLNENGIKTQVFNIPVTFPAEGKSNGKLLAGLGVPDITGSIGKPAFFTTSETFKPSTGEFTVELTKLLGNDEGVYYTFVKGPDRKNIKFQNDDVEKEPEMKALSYLDEGEVLKDTPEYMFKNKEKTLVPEDKGEPLAIPMKLTVDKKNESVTIEIQGIKQTVKKGEWSDWFELEFKYSPVLSLWGMARFVPVDIKPDLKLYLCPINLHPSHTPIPISAPKSWAGELFDKYGVYKTVGWAVDTWSLQEELISEENFLEEAYYTRSRKEQILYNSIENMEHNLHVQYFEYIDRIQHLFWRLIDEGHPYYDDKKAMMHKKAIMESYQDMDRIVGEVMKRVDEDTYIFVVSDHGFVSWRRAFNYNTWLKENGYLHVNDYSKRDMEVSDLFENRSENFWPNVDWSKSYAYSLGIGNVYLNVANREPEGIIKDEKEYIRIRDELVDKMPKWIDSATGMNPVIAVYKREDIWDDFDPNITPDLRVCTNEYYRVSWQSTLGNIPKNMVYDVMRNWSGDHCSADPSLVRGIFFSSKKITKEKPPKLVDFFPTIMSIYGLDPDYDVSGENLFK